MHKLNYKSKSIIAVLLLILLFGTTSGIKAYAATNSQMNDIIDLTGIMKDKAGNALSDGKYVTRAEFAQMLIQASSYIGEVDGTNVYSLFKDVTKNSEQAAYVQIAVTKGYMSGYLKGLFKPDKAITLKEAMYGTLGLLGYTKEDFAGKQANARYNTFKELGLSKNLSSTEKSKLTKQDCVILFYNLLNAKQKGGEIYCKTLGYTVNSDNTIEYKSVLSLKTKGPVVVAKDWEKQLSNKLSTYTILKNNEEVTSGKLAANSIVYYSEAAKMIWVYDEKLTGTIENITYNQGLPQDITISGTTYPVEKPEALKSLIKSAKVQKGSLVTLLLGRDDQVSYLYSIKSTLAEAGWKNELSFVAAATVIYKNDVKASVNDIANNDVLYYSTKLSTVWAYDKKVYGLLDNITYSQGEPQEVTIAGTSYIVEHPAVMKKELNAASIQTGTPVILLLGRDNKVVRILKLSCVIAEGNWQDSLISLNNNTVINKDGTIISLDKIDNNDVLYYSKELNTIWVYSKKVYGIIDMISPSLASPTSITVAGTAYELKLLPVNTTVSDDLSTSSWGERLRTNNIKSGVNVVVLFGYNGNVVDVKLVDTLQTTLSGYVLSVETKYVKIDTLNNEVLRYIHIVDSDGALREFLCNDLNIKKGTVVTINFQLGAAVIKAINSTFKASIPSDINTFKLSDSIKILEVNDQKYTKVTTTQLKENVWSVENVLYYKVNSANEITELIITNVTDSFYQYGVLTNIVFPNDEAGIYSFELTFTLNGTETTLTTDMVKWNMNLGPKAILIEDGKLKDLKDLNEVRISYISGKQANIGESVCRISDDVVVLYYNAGVYYKTNLDDIIDASKYNIFGYRKLQGAIRVIVITNR